MNAIATQAAQANGRHMTKREALKASADRIAAQRDAVRATLNKGAPSPSPSPAAKAPAVKASVKASVKRANKGGRIASLSPADRQREIRDLLRELHSASDSDEKKRIRRALRARDHWGGARGADSVDDTLKAKAPEGDTSRVIRPAVKGAKQASK